MFDPVTEDPAPDLDFPAETNRVRFSSHGSALNGVFFLVQGSGFKPTVVLLHGIPGTDRNFDLAHAFRRAGMNVLVFHYRGAWGSEGAYSFAHVLEDVRAALDWLVDSPATMCVDVARIALVGHSLGGWASLMTAASNARVRCVVSLAGANLGAWWDAVSADATQQRTLEADMASMTSIQMGATGASLVHEMREHRLEWNLTNHAQALATKPVMLVAGTRDADLPPELHHAPLVNALEAHAGNVQALELNADHMFADTRIAVARATLNWLQAHL